MFTENPEIAVNMMTSQHESSTSGNDEIIHIALLDLTMLLQPNCMKSFKHF